MALRSIPLWPYTCCQYCSVVQALARPWPWRGVTPAEARPEPESSWPSWSTGTTRSSWWRRCCWSGSGVDAAPPRGHAAGVSDSPDAPAPAPQPRRRPSAATQGAGDGQRARPAKADPQVWRLVEALSVAMKRLPYATAEARLLDGVGRWLSLEARGLGAGGPVRLQPHGPRWAAVLALVTASARLCSDEAQALLAPWTTGVAGAPGAPGVSPHAAAAADFVGGARG